MSFHSEKVPEFQALFLNICEKIKGFEGCHGLELYRDPNAETVFYTHSLWEDEHHLNQYRSSKFFEETWAKTKKLFNEKPQAFSLVK